MKILKGKEQEYKDWLDKNQDDYGKGVLDFAERWAKLMETEIEESNKAPIDVIVDCANRLSHEADTDGITGFMYGCAVNVLSRVWEYGEELRKWHNKEYNYEGDGVVNPAVLVIDK